MAIWTVNDRARAEALFAAGMDAVFTDRPDLFP
jgi:glycerophosphoryl diester phosphodiesterase